MAGRIPEQFIDDVVARTDLVELIGNRLKLKKSGSNHTGLCPFHNEKSPSFNVSETKQLYHCFGCGASGNALTFLIEHDRLDFVEAIEQLANQLGMEVPREEASQQSKDAYLKKKQQQQQLFELMEKASQYFQQQLRQHGTKDKAINYLKGRGMTGQIAKHFQLGFAPAGWDNLLKSLGTDKETRKQLAIAGLLAEKEQKPDDYYDRFRDRIIFPIIDTSGRTIAFGGRVLAKDEKPKYYNSPETPIFNKSQTLYGLYQARKQDRHPKQLLVVEGYMDVIALAQHGIHNAVACLGTALTEDHVRLLFKQTSQIIFCFDGDAAGKKAAKKALEHSLNQLIDGREVKFLFLDDGEDPDTLVSKGGKTAFDQALSSAASIDQFLFSLFDDTSSLEGKARLAKEAMPMIQQVPGDFIRNLLTQELARRTGLNEETLTKQTTKQTSKQAPQANAPRYGNASTGISEKKRGTANKNPNRSIKQNPKKNTFDAPHQHAPMNFNESSSFHYPEAYEQDSAFDPNDYYSDDNLNPPHHSSQQPSHTNQQSKLAFNTLRLVVHQPNLIQTLNSELLQFTPDTHTEELLSEILHHLKKETSHSTAQLIGYFQDSEHFDLLTLALANPPHTENLDLSSQLTGYLEKLKKEQQTRKMIAIKEKIQNKTATKEETRLFFQEQQKEKKADKK